MSGGPQSQPADARPVPDPTALTTQALLREIDNLTKQVQAEFAVRDQRFEAMDKALELFQSSIIRVPTDVDKQVGNLRELIGAQFSGFEIKFDGVQTQFKERDTRSERESRDNKVAVDAAFAAQKEASARQDDSNQKAIDKSEGAMTEKVNKLGELFQTTNDALRGNVSDLKDRLTTIEGKSTGQGQTWGVMVAALGALLGVVGLVWGMTH